MKRSILAAVLAAAAATAGLGAQTPGPRMGPAGPGRRAIDNPAEFLLAQTGELKLTDAQVTRLAAIARRSAERRRALRAQMDSMRPERPFAGQRPDSAARERMRQRFQQMQPSFERLRDQAQADRRDAIAVLTPDQQALAWERIAMRSRMMPRSGFGAGRGFRSRPGGLRGGAMPGGRMRGQGMGPRGTGPGRMGPPADDTGGDRPRPAPRRRPEDQSVDP